MGKGVGYREFYRPLRGTKSGNWGLRFFCESILGEGEMDMEPEYQRGHVWTKDQQMDFLGFCLEGGKIPEIFVRELPLPRSGVCEPPYYEIVDGKQRTTALNAWWTGEIPARLMDGRLVWAKDMDEVERRSVSNDLMLTVQFLQTNFKETLEIYLRLNRGGTPHTDAEIDHVKKLYEAENAKANDTV